MKRKTIKRRKPKYRIQDSRLGYSILLLNSNGRVVNAINYPKHYTIEAVRQQAKELYHGAMNPGPVRRYRKK